MITFTSQLSDVDKMILRELLSPNSRFSSRKLSEKLGIPESTVQRRRKRLEKELLTVSYSLDVGKLGWHRIEFLVSTQSGKTFDVARKILERDEVTYVVRSIGQFTIDLKVEVILSGNAEILDMLEFIRAIDGVKDAVWTEAVEVIGRKRSVPNHVINKL